MKKSSLLIMMLLIVTTAFSQSVYVKYEYDAAGNRVSRKYMSVTLPSSAKKSFVDTTGVTEDFGKLKVTIYPNPTKGVLLVDVSSSQIKSGNFKLFTTEGKLLIQDKIQSSQTPVNLTNQVPGIYYLKMWINDEKFEFKIIKQ